MLDILFVNRLQWRIAKLVWYHFFHYVRLTQDQGGASGTGFFTVNYCIRGSYSLNM